MKVIIKILVIMIVLTFCLSAFAEKVGKLNFYKGKVMVKVNGKGRWIPVKLNMKLNDKDMIRTSKNSVAKIKLRNGSIYEVKSGKIVRMNKIVSKAGKLNKISSLAKLRILKNKLGKGSGSGLDVPTAVAGVRGADVSEKSSSPINPSDLIWEE